MATVTDPIILDSTGQAIKNSIDLLSANINRTASNIPYDSNLTIKAAIDGKVSKTGDTMTGNLLVDRGSSGDSNVLIGGNVSRGVLRLYHTNGKYANIYPYGFTENRNINLPDNGGIIALTSDISFRGLASGSWSWNTQASYSIEAYSRGSVIVYGARDGRGFLAICPNNNNEIYVISNNIGCAITNAYDGNTGKHTITFSNRTAYTGSNVFVYVIG